MLLLNRLESSTKILYNYFYSGLIIADKNTNLPRKVLLNTNKLIQSSEKHQTQCVTNEHHNGLTYYHKKNKLYNTRGILLIRTVHNHQHLILRNSVEILYTKRILSSVAIRFNLTEKNLELLI
jgi:hypothetical protein